MKNYIITIFLVLTLGGCGKKEISPEILKCYPGEKFTRSRRVDDQSVLVRISGGLFTGFQLIATNGVAWSACSLPDEFRRDSSKIFVSGYFLTSPELHLQNVSPLPFEITSARLR